MTEDEEFIFESILNQVRMGFLSMEEIKENIQEEIEDNELGEDISEEWASKMIESEFEKLISESASWIRPTDTEKLIKAFNELISENIIALHCAGYTTSDGEDEVVEVETTLRSKGKESAGYCFYHEQDLERALDPDGPVLMIAFQKVNNTDDNITIDVGRKVVETLKRNGFQINWDETATSKIEIQNFHWKKCYHASSEDLQDYSNVANRMLK